MKDFDQFLAECRSGNLQKIDAFLRNEAILQKVRADGAKNNDALRNSVESGNVYVVNRLLRIPEVLAGATALNNYALNRAIELEHFDVVTRLFNIKAVCDKYIDIGNLEDNISKIDSKKMLHHVLQAPKVLKAIEREMQNGQIKLEDEFIIKAIDSAKNIKSIRKVMDRFLPSPITDQIKPHLKPKHHESKPVDDKNHDHNDKYKERSKKRPKA